MCRLRGDDIGMVFQEPMTALNPVKTIGEQVAEGIRWHTRVVARRGRGAGAEDARPRRPARGTVSAVALSAPAVRRPAPARRDRDRLRAEAKAADCRRADHRARRRPAGADPRPAARSRRREQDGPAADLARPGGRHRHGRPHRHHEGRQRGGDRRDGAHAVGAESPLHAPAGPGLDPRAGAAALPSPLWEGETWPPESTAIGAERRLPGGGDSPQADPRLLRGPHRGRFVARSCPQGDGRPPSSPSKTSRATIPAIAARCSANPRRSARSTMYPSRWISASRSRWSAARAAASRRWRA